MNLKKLYRLYKEKQLQLRRKGKKRLKSEGRGLPQAATLPNQEWCLDFVHDCLSDGRSFRSLTMLDAFTRQCLHIECDTSLSSERVVRVLEQLRQSRGVPQRLRIDNGPEFRSKNLDGGPKSMESICSSSSRGNRHRTDKSNPSMDAFEPNA